MHDRAREAAGGSSEDGELDARWKQRQVVPQKASTTIVQKKIRISSTSYAPVKGMPTANGKMWIVLLHAVRG